jgi:lipopolysaccharide assembly outer membrane protein LptD (OstA)
MKRTALAAAVAVVAGLALGQGGGAVPFPVKPGDSGMESTADKFEVDQKSGWITFTGNVKVRTGDHELRADRVRLNQETGDVQARGNVVIQQGGFGTWSGDYIEYNYKTGRGLTGAGDMKAGAFRVLTHEVTRREDGRYDAKHIQVTTCTNAPGSWHWCVTGHGRYKDNDYVEVFEPCLDVRRHPSAYQPYWYPRHRHALRVPPVYGLHHPVGA